MKATLIGATGLIGSHLLEILLQDPAFEKVTVLVRKPLLGLSHPKLEKKLVDFNDADALLVALHETDVIFCAVGTTQQKVKGDQAAYRKVDFDIPAHTARFGKMNGCEKYVLVSALGAKKGSANFYLNLKGEAEEAVIASGMRSVHFMRPSILEGNRKEKRTGERIGIFIARIFSFLLPSRLKLSPAVMVAGAMSAAAKTDKPGAFIYQNAEMKSLIQHSKFKIQNLNQVHIRHDHHTHHFLVLMQYRGLFLQISLALAHHP